MEQVAAAVVDATKFLTACEASSQAKKIARLLKTLTVNRLIRSEVSVGRVRLASFILPNAFSFNKLLLFLENLENTIITNLDNLPNIELLVKAISKNNYLQIRHLLVE